MWMLQNKWARFWWENRITSLEKTPSEADILMTEEPWSHGGATPSFLEGTLGQLKIRFGIEGADKAVKDLRCIWISHIHADHHVGLTRILALRRDLLKGLPHEPIIVVGPRQLKIFLDAYQRFDLNMQFLDRSDTMEVSLEALESNEENVKSQDPRQTCGFYTFCSRKLYAELLEGSGSHTQNAAEIPILKSLQKALNEAESEMLICSPAVHCSQAFRVVLQGANRINGVGKTVPGWKIVCSGETRPCPELVKASFGATVLIHEATFEDSMVDEAIARNHSTTKEAVEVGDSAGVYRIILYSFQPKIPRNSSVQRRPHARNMYCILSDECEFSGFACSS